LSKEQCIVYLIFKINAQLTRQKRNARYEMLEHHKVNKSQGLLFEQTIRLTGAKSQAYRMPFGRIAYRDAATGSRCVFLANH
jgi:hypothetical protein